MSWITSPTLPQAWTLLLVAGVLEVGWAIGMKSTDGFSRAGPTALVTGTLIASFALLGMAMKTLPAGTAYAVWVGIGATGTGLAGNVVLRRTRDSVAFFVPDADGCRCHRFEAASRLIEPAIDTH
jgi:quaternary ammonium compound-resistance protein SugE